MSEQLISEIQPSDANSNPEGLDALAEFLADPSSHLSDLLYIWFRIYKKRVLWDFMQTALKDLKLGSQDELSICDIGAAMGFDLLYLLRKMTHNFAEPLPCKGIRLSLIEGDADLADRGRKMLAKQFLGQPISFTYQECPFVETLPLISGDSDIVLCSEVVEHLEDPGHLFREFFRVLKPGGFVLLTTDNSPSLPQMIRRIPAILTGRYQEKYARPSKESELVAHTLWQGKDYPIYGHINLNSTQHWEELAKSVGFKIAGFGTYESIRRGGGGQSPASLAFYFLFGAVVYHLMPRRLGRLFGDTTALLLKKPHP